MSQWQKVCSLCQTNPTFHRQLSDLFGRINFPIKIRFQCSTWLESQNWDFDKSTADGVRRADELFQKLLTQLQVAVDAARQDEPYERFMELEIIITNLKRDFQGSGVRFVEVMRQCLREELSLIQSFDSVPEEDRFRRSATKCAEENVELKLKLEALKIRIDAASRDMREVDRYQEEFLAYCKHKQQDYYSQQQKAGASQLNEAEFRARLLHETKPQTELNFTRRNRMAKDLIDLAIELALLIKVIWEEILRWQANQRLSVTGLSHSLEGALDLLDKLCDNGGQLLHQIISQVEHAIAICRKVNYAQDAKKTDLERVLRELKEEYLPNYLRRTFVIEQNISDRFLKISGSKSVQFAMSVRVLGGRAMGLAFTKPTVRMSIFPEFDLPVSDTYVRGMCEIDGGAERPFVVSAMGVSARFNSVKLKDFKRSSGTISARGGGAGGAGGSAGDELVTEQKYAVVFSTVIRVCDLDIPIKVVSLPLILISQTSQEIMAKGTIIWDAAFSDEMREPYKYRDTVRWCEVSSLLNALFTTHTGRGLNPDQLKYLAKMAFRTERNDVDFDSYAISEKQIVKDKMPGRDFSMWKWFWACMNLVKEEVKQEWNDGLIYGFISKQDASAKLIDCQCGTFLLRFSETEIEHCQKANICGYLTLAVIEKDPVNGLKKLFHVREYLRPKDIQTRKGLAGVLDAMQVEDYDKPEKKQLLRYLWPDTNVPFQQRFKIDTPDQVAPDPYTPAKFIIEIFLGTQPAARNRRDSMESVESDAVSREALSPPSSMLSSPCGAIQELDEGGQDVFNLGCFISDAPQSPVQQQQQQQQQQRPVGSVAPFNRVTPAAAVAPTAPTHQNPLDFFPHQLNLPNGLAGGSNYAGATPLPAQNGQLFAGAVNEQLYAGAVLLQNGQLYAGAIPTSANNSLTSNGFSSIPGHAYNFPPPGSGQQSTASAVNGFAAAVPQLNLEQGQEQVIVLSMSDDDSSNSSPTWLGGPGSN